MKRFGFTLVELSITLGLLAVFFTMTSFTLLTTLQHSSLATSETTLIADIRTQQLKAMQGDTEGESGPQSFGVYLDSDHYTLFRGSAYDGNDPSNFTVILDTSLRFSEPAVTIVFARGSGEATPQSFALVQEDAGISHIFSLNKYGVISED